MIKFRTKYGEKIKVQKICDALSRTKQSFKAECDVNNILKKYRNTGILPQASKAAFYGDFSNVSDFQTAVAMVHEADEKFMALPAHIRKEFNNDPQQLLGFLETATKDDLEAIGLLDPNAKEPVQAPVVAPVESNPPQPTESEPQAKK